MIETPISPEVKKQHFRDRSDEVLERKITVENINSYVNDAVSDLIRLTDELVESYKADTTDLDPNLSGKEIEDLAYVAYGLPNINDYLGVAQEKIKELEEIDSFIEERVVHINEVITPPNKDAKMPTHIGEEIYARPGTKNRLKTLLYVLKESGIDFEKIQIQEGVVSQEMVRWLSYFSVEVPEIDRLILVCDEEQNASYVFDTEKLKLLGLSISDINRMLKPELNQFIADHPGVGVRFIQSKNWRNRLELFLLEEIPSQKIADLDLSEKPEKRDVSDVPNVSNIELDPWKRFLTDNDSGKHWGPIWTIAERLSVNNMRLLRIAKSNNLESRKIRDVIGRERDCYCYEELEKLAEVFTSVPQVAKEGVWKGFLTDDDSGKHWGPIWTIAERLSISNGMVLRIVKHNNPESRKIRDVAGHLTDDYCYEELEKLAEVFTSVPQVAKEGVWKGFLTDDDSGKHWGPIKALIRRFGLSRQTISKIAKSNNLESRKIRDVIGSERDCYCYEELEEKFRR